MSTVKIPCARRIKDSYACRYTFQWNVTYGVSSSPSEANSTNLCGPGPFSYQSWVLNKTLTASVMGPDVGILETTVTSSLPTEPTGKVVASGVTSSLPTEPSGNVVASGTSRMEISLMRATVAVLVAFSLLQ